MCYVRIHYYVHFTVVVVGGGGAPVVAHMCVFFSRKYFNDEVTVLME